MTICFKKNGQGSISGCSINFGSKEMRNLNLIENGKLKKIKNVENEKNKLIIYLEKA